MIQVGEADISIARREAFINRNPVDLGSRAFDVLEKLLDTPNRVVTKQELLDAAWPDTFVEENNLKVQIHNIRKLLNFDRKTLETVYGRGYRLNVFSTSAPMKTGDYRDHHDYRLAAIANRNKLINSLLVLT